jgi:protein-disulfide isomerase
MSLSRSLVLGFLVLSGCGRGADDRVGTSPGDSVPVARASAPVARADNTACDCKVAATPPAPTPAARVAIEVGESPTRGPRNARVTLVVFTDFECPFCAKAAPRLQALADKYRGDVKVVFKNQPLPMHDRARVAAKAALAADEQGKFWEMHDALFSSRALDPVSLEATATELGLDVTKWRSAMTSDAVERRIAADVVEAHRLDVTGTPTFFVNGRRIVGAQPLEVFSAAIEEELAGK